MSTSTPTEPGARIERHPGFTKFIRRASRVLRRGSSSKSGSISNVAEVEAPRRSTPGTVAGPSSVSPSSPKHTAPPEPKFTSPPELPLSLSVPLGAQPLLIRDTRHGVKSIETSRRDPRTSADHSAIQQARATALIAKYGLAIEPVNRIFAARSDTVYVEKKIKMRVHRQCHRCEAMFGVEKICSYCQHTRCKKCPRFPEKKPKFQQKEIPIAPSRIIPPGIQQTTVFTNFPDLVLTMPSRVTGKELYRRVQTQRVRRTCHRCNSTFPGKATMCDTCHHMRCPQCPRDPPKLSKYPTGYPGDVPETYPLAQRHFRSIRMRFRWICHACTTVFLDHEITCRGCNHERCLSCPRDPPKKLKAGFSDDAIASIEGRMRRMDISPQTQISAT